MRNKFFLKKLFSFVLCVTCNFCLSVCWGDEKVQGMEVNKGMPNFLLSPSILKNHGYTFLVDDNPYKYDFYYYDDESGLYYLMARYYSSELMRFISKDTYDLTNRYNYCSGDPFKKDPTGHEATESFLISASAIIQGFLFGLFVPNTYIALGLSVVSGSGSSVLTRYLFSGSDSLISVAVSGAFLSLGGYPLGSGVRTLFENRRALIAMRAAVNEYVPPIVDRELLTLNEVDTGEDDICSICLTKLTGKKTPCPLNSEHSFHGECLKNWIEIEMTSSIRVPTCPTCREYLIRPNATYEYQEQEGTFKHMFDEIRGKLASDEGREAIFAIGRNRALKGTKSVVEEYHSGSKIMNRGSAELFIKNEMMKAKISSVVVALYK